MSNAPNAQLWVDDIEKHILAKQQIMIKAAADCAPINKMISEVKSAAKNDGISVKVLNALILERKHLRNAANVREKLEDDDLVAELEVLRDGVRAVEGIEDLFSFAAAEIDEKITAIKSRRGKKQAERAASDSAAVDSLTDDDLPEDDEDPRPRFMKEAEAEHVADNVTKIGKGIKPLH